jgi:hypothetical protein
MKYVVVLPVLMYFYVNGSSIMHPYVERCSDRTMDCCGGCIDIKLSTPS